ncbi:ABC transporter substrate-binding protein [Candidatus Cryosericum septentrionale]|nr:ABC transporter substrate-binding protein [Candidatus Cryosericum septentrionale]
MASEELTPVAALIRSLGEELETGRLITRKAFLQRAAGLGIALPLASTLFAACGSSTKTNSSAAGSATQTLVIASGADALTLDPGASYDGISPCLWMAAYESLLRYEGTSAKVIPQLADFEVSEDGLTYTFRIHPNIKFIDGEVLDAAAVKLNIERQIGTKIGVSYALGNLKKIETPDDMTVVLSLSDSYDGFLSAFAGEITVMMISPKAITDHKGSDWAQSWLRHNMVGSGPYMLESYTQGSKAVFTKNPTYWRGWNGQHADKVVVIYTHNVETEQLQLEQGSVDAALYLSEDGIKSLLSKPGISVTDSPSFDEYYLMLNCDKAPTANPEVRRAIAYGFDYGTYVNTVQGGLGAVQARGPIPPGLAGYNPNVQQYSYDPKKAKELLAAAGYPNGGLTLKLAYEAEFKWKGTMATLFQSNMRDLGIDVSIHQEANLNWLSDRAKADAAYPWWFYPLLNTAGDYLYSQFASTAQGTAGSNGTYYTNKTFDSLLTKAAACPVQSTRDKYYAQAQEILVRDCPALFVMFRNQRIPLRSNVKGFVFNGMSEGTFNFYDMYKA